LAAIYGNYENLIGIVNDGSFGLSKKALEDYGQLQKSYEEDFQFAQNLALKAADPDSYFMHTICASKERLITLDDLTNACEYAPLRSEDRRLVQFIITHYELIANAHGDRYFFAKHEISIDDMRDYENKVPLANKYKTVASVNSILRRTNESQNSSNGSLFSDRLDPLKSVTPDALKEGRIGDRYFEAAVASVAKMNPSSIKDMIEDNRDGTYTVTFPGAKNEPITVLAPTEAECGLYNSGSPHGVWAMVLEKAHGLYTQQHLWRRNNLENRGGHGVIEGGSGAGFNNGLSLLTGNAAEMHILALEDREDLRNCLNEALNSPRRRSVITFTGPDKPGFRGTADNSSRGVHSILGFDPYSAGGGTITIRNPWGYDENGRAGTINISFDQYANNFCGFFSESCHP
jgi:hypothetical protein